MGYTHSPKEPIAIIGCGCRLPGDSTSPSKLWDLLYSPRDLVRELSAESRFNARGFYHENGERHGASNASTAYLIEEDPRRFDASFFSIAPREAESIDPQQRLLMETVYEAMEDAGLTLNEMRGSETAAYMGAMSADYTDTQLRDIESLSKYLITGTSRALLSNRLSYFFDWKGPSISVDTACSSSMVAVHLGVQALRAGECKTACVGGSNLILNPDCYLAATSLHLLSPTGRSQMWDQAANGYARGEGVCVFFMKTLSQALQDGDRIDALIRETCVNSDGRTQGIALPSAEAQISLMRATYKNAGLDLSEAQDRPQYVEAHGTGTKAGDPREASAIATTFFPPHQNHDHRPKLLVGSIKTVIGHTEGCAGIAGLLKTILAMKHKIVPPNLHFRHINPSVKPSFKYLSIATSPEPWPEVPPNTPLRASVNGFGSGGTNCHGIVETYVPEVHDRGPWGGRSEWQREPPDIDSTPDADFCPMPLLFSASSGTALCSMLERYEEYLETHDVSIQRLAMTLSRYRSTFPVRISISGTSRTEILEAIRNELDKVRSHPDAEIGTRSAALDFDRARRPKILGVFTGQGAQWAGMGQALMERSRVFRESVEMMEKAMGTLPDGPAWSLREELMKPPSTSRIGEAEFSLPLCAALQVGLVRILRSAGIHFSMVVGHSSGEIGSAYAAGKLDEAAAIQLAYYRGLYTKLAGGKDGRKGGMMAVGFGFEEGLRFCALEQFADRITIAASNSPTSVTLSGDLDAIHEAKEMLDAEGVFNRVLRLNTAFHSPHMYPTAAPFLAAMERCGITVGKSNGTAWASSVYEDNRMITPAEDADMAGTYWRDNLAGRVLFSQAVERTMDVGNDDFDLALEVGPHPTLKGPALETIRHKIGSEIPYFGVLERNSNDILALSNALGSSWLKLGSGVLDFAGYASGFDSVKASTLSAPALPDLPPYPWDHKQVLYRESRLNKNVRSRVDAPHPLLGARTPDDTDYEPRWRNFLILEELPWLRDHCVQNQMVVPAAAYCVMALEAAKVLCRGKSVQRIELSNVSIQRPIVLDEASDGTETLLSVHSDLDSNDKQRDEIHAQFSISIGEAENRHLRTAATGQILIILANGSVGSRPEDLFPTGPQGAELDLLPTSTDRFYESMQEIGLGYTGPFRAITSMKRRLNIASATVAIDRDLVNKIPVHPTWLDACFQTFLAAIAAPRDGLLWTSFLPTTIGRMVVFVSPPQASQSVPPSVIVDTNITKFTPGYEAALPALMGDMAIFNSETNQLQIRIEDFVMSSFLPASEKDDRRLYLKNVWGQEMLSGAICESEDHRLDAPDSESKVIATCESAIRYYLSKIRASEHLDELLNKCPGLHSLLRQTEAHPTSIPTRSDMISMLEEVGEHIDLVLVRTIGESLLNSPAEGLGPADSQAAPPSMGTLITRWHNEGLGFAQLRKHFVSATKQISHQHPNLRILQVGPSSPELVHSICQELGHSLTRYTVVDDSEDNVEEIRSTLATDEFRVDVKQASIEAGVDEIGHLKDAGLFDVVIAHKAFTNQVAALKNIRSLLRPGGFMLMMAATGMPLRFPFFMLSAPPLLDEEGLVQTDYLNPTREKIHSLLQGVGFSGVDSMALDNVAPEHTFSVVVAQALDDQIGFLRSPLTCPSPAPLSGTLLVVGGLLPDIANLSTSVQTKISKAWQGDVIHVRTPAELTDEPSQVEAILSFTDLDRPILEGMTAPTYKGLQAIFSTPAAVLWVTQGAKAGNPYHNATIGIGRSVQSENEQKALQFLDLNTLDGAASAVAESFLRFIGGINMKRDSATKRSHLWTIEPEIALEEGKYLVPRLFPDTQRNDRTNALRRKVETQAAVESQPVVLVPATHNDDPVSYVAEAVSNHGDISEDATDSVTVQVEYCSLHPVIPCTGEGDLFCYIGRTPEGARVVGLSTSNASVVKVPRTQTIEVDNDETRDDGSFMMALMGEIKLLVIASSVRRGCTTLVYEPDAHLAASLQNSNQQDISCLAFKANKPQPISGSLVFMESNASRKQLQARLPSKLETVVDMRRETTARKLLALKQALPTHAVVCAFDDISTHGIDPHGFLAKALDVVRGDAPSKNISIEHGSVVKASDLVSGETREWVNAAVVVDWTGPQSITLRQRPIDMSNLFSPNKTYLLVGLTGDIGQSMCRWMVSNGARHIVVTSRNPEKQGQLWKEELLRQGINIITEAADVTNKRQVMELRKRIVSSMPPIGGIANGAMVLDDITFADMPFESFQKVVRPKVQGSLNLEEIFSCDELEFFLLFSSIVVMTGQPKQANYVAANNFMVAMAERRRALGLPASVIDIGMVPGIGYVARTQDDRGVSILEDALRQMHYMPLSDTDLHHLFAEAILAGQTSEYREITTGLATYKPATEGTAFWHRHLRFCHLIPDPNVSQGNTNTLQSVQKPLREMLLSSSESEATQVMEGALKGFLASTLKLSMDSIYSDVPIIDLGIDSLVAVQIRNWIWAEAGHDIPVLKILGGSSIQQICSEVASHLSVDKTPTGAAKVEGQATSPQKTRPWDPQPHTGNGDDIPAAPKPEVAATGQNGLPTDTSKAPRILSQKSKSPGTAQTRDGAATKGPRPTPMRTHPLSLGQSRLYFLSQYLADDTVLNCVISYTLSGRLDVSKLERSINAVVQLHETMRTSFYTDDKQGKPMQGILSESPFQLKTVYGVNDSSAVEEEFNLIRCRHYDLERADTFAATVLSDGRNSHTLIFGYHHIIMDGVSWQIFQKDMALFYNDSSSATLSKYSPAQYSEFTLKQHRNLSRGAYNESLDFFRQEFPKPLDPLPLLPFAKVGTRKALKQYSVQEVVTHLDANVVSAIKKTAQASRTTASHFYLSAFQVVLHRLLETDKMCIGVVDANRSDQEFVNTVGFFLETIPLLFEVDDGKRFSEVLKATRSKMYAAFAQSGVPTEEILRECGAASSTTETPLFQICFNYRMGAGRTSPLQGLDMRFLDYDDAKNPFDLVLSVDDLDDGTAMLTLHLQDYLYDQEGAKLLANIYKHVLEVLSKNTESLVGDVPIFHESLAREAIEPGTGPLLDLAPPFAGTLSKMIDTWVVRDPHALAVKDMSGKTRTYLQLSERSNAIAAALFNAGAKSSSVIGVLLEPCVDTIATILAILRIGAVYVPLDTRNSDGLLSDILRESHPQIVLHHAATAQRSKTLVRGSPESKLHLLTLNAVPQKTVRSISDNSALDGVAMILYTSGSTGKPKGIPLTNVNIRTPILGVSERVPLGREIVLQQSGQGFDAAIYQIFTALANGGTLIMADNRAEPAELAALMASEAVTCTTLIASEMQALLKYGHRQLRRCSAWRIAMVAGEAFTANLLDQFRALGRPDLKVFNAYGPTEASICSSLGQVSTETAAAEHEHSYDHGSIPIGKAIANYGTYIVDQDCRPVPVGWPGEVAITGPGVASGYLNLPQLTHDKFRTSTSLGSIAGSSSVYLTGDKGRMLADGSIVLSGRVDGDDQVKIRGHRVQLGEVARLLVQVSRGILEDAVVLLKGGEGDDATKQQLVAYVVFSSTSHIRDATTYLRQLNHKLPVQAYMRPTIVIPLDSLPRTERGKLDTKKLSSLPLPKRSVDQVADSELKPSETKLRDIWIRVLGEISSSVSIHRGSDFFSVGGNSLLLLALKCEIFEAFGVEIPIPELFQASTLELLASRLSNGGKSLSSSAHIDWEEETDLDEAMFAPLLLASNAAHHRRRPSRGNIGSSRGLSVLLTGATGFLGGGILRHLVARPDVARVHCVGIRPDPEGQQPQARRLSAESPKIVRHAGDLALPRLGLSEHEYAALVRGGIDVIIHNGAEVSLLQSYRSLRATNFLSTVELAQLAVAAGAARGGGRTAAATPTPTPIPIHYVSTAGVARLSGADTQPEASLAAFAPPTDGTDGYVASKWASEVFLEKFQRRFPTGPVWIHRPSSITTTASAGGGGDGDGNNNNNNNELPPSLDTTNNLIEFSRKLKAVPDLAGSTGFFDFVDIDTVAGNIVGSITTEDEKAKGDGSGSGSGSLNFRHESGDRLVPVCELAEYIQRLEGQSIRVLPLEKWVAMAIEHGLDEVLGSCMLSSKGVIRAPLLRRDHSEDGVEKGVA